MDTIKVNIDDTEYTCIKCNSKNSITKKDTFIMCLYYNTDVICSNCKSKLELEEVK